MSNYPVNTETAIRMESLIKHKEQLMLHERMSSRMVKCDAVRFDNPDMQTGLTRLDAFNAITTLSVDGQQTKPFTLETERPKRQKNGEEISARIEQNSIERLVRPYRSLRALTPAEILDYLNHPDKLKSGVTGVSGQVTRNENSEMAIPDWFSEWKKKRESIIKAS